MTEEGAPNPTVFVQLHAALCGAQPSEASVGSVTHFSRNTWHYRSGERADSARLSPITDQQVHGSAQTVADA
jgi:hypothetical protein